jgi:alpha-tubulin suppressor-like RCC1 family protein
VKFRAVTTGLAYTCGLAIDGAAWCWGSNGSGQLGTGTLTQSLVPVAVSGGLTFK